MENLISKDILRQCSELGFAASRWPALREYSLIIFEAIKEAAPDNPAWIVGSAMVYACADENPDEARNFMLKHGISSNSGDPLARAFLGIFLIVGLRPCEGEEVLRSVVADGSDSDAVRLAKATLDNMHLAS